MPPAGRPRTFDRDEALKKAMLVFWEKGYEGTTMSDLISTIGMKAPSVYAAFGNKDALFNEVLGLYNGIVKEGPLKALHENAHILEAIKQSMHENISIFTSPNNPSSCLVMTAAINCTPENTRHVEKLKDVRADYKGAIKARLSKAAEEGQLVEAANIESLAEFYTTFIHGLAMRARDGSTNSELSASCEYALLPLKAALK